MDQATKRQKRVEIQPIDICVEESTETCGETSSENGVICTGKKVYRPPLPSTYKKTELLEYLKYGM